MRVAIHIPRMLPDNDFYFRLGHAAPAPVSLRTDRYTMCARFFVNGEHGG